MSTEPMQFRAVMQMLPYGTYTSRQMIVVLPGFDRVRPRSRLRPGRWPARGGEGSDRRGPVDAT